MPRRIARSMGDPTRELSSASLAVGRLLAGTSVSPHVRNGAVNGDTANRIRRMAQNLKRPPHIVPHRTLLLQPRSKRDFTIGMEGADMIRRTRYAWPLLLVVLGAALTAAAQSTPAPDAAAEVLAFERAIEDAVVRGDVRFVDAASAPTFTFTHGDGWTTGGAPIRVDSRADWLATV